MMRKMSMLLLVGVLALILAAPVMAAGPTFEPAIYADGEVWATKGVAPLPPPNGKNNKSFDKLFLVPGQMPVGEAAPGNPAFNGGRWFTHTVEWLGTPELVTSYAQLHALEEAGVVEITPGSPEGGPPPYFECPLLPVK